MVTCAMHGIIGSNGVAGANFSVDDSNHTFQAGFPMNKSKPLI